jgi:predicted HTH transcriptional regulator
MFDSKEELLEKIALGEDAVLELKAVRFRGSRVEGPSRDDLADELAALANSHNAVVVLGVDDRTKEILGIPVERLDLVETFVRDTCQDSIKPPLVATIIRMLLPGSDGTDRAVIKIDVPRSLFVHKSPGGYFHRLGSSKRELSTELLLRLAQQRSQSRIIRFDEQVVSGATIEDLDRPLFERFRGSQSRDADADLLHKLAMARHDDQGQLRPTVTGVLLGSREPRRWLPNAFIQAVAYRGRGVVPEQDDANYQLDAAELSGPLDQQILDACKFVRRNMWVAAAKGEGRRDLAQFDMVPVFEALVNAVAHRDYSIYGSKIRLRMFEDRLELSSPGALANTMTIDSLAFRQSARNEAISSLLAKCVIASDDEWIGTTRRTLMDKRGEGVSVILERGERHAGKRPIYQLFDDSELRLTIFSASRDSPRRDGGATKADEEIST